MKFAPRISPQVRAQIERLAERSLSAAEITRAVGDGAERLGQTRPSYEQVRALVREVRRRPRQPSTADVLLDVAFRVRHPNAVAEHLAGLSPPIRRDY
ncbi:MAG TPA: hypothetical protein VI142_06625 [Gaiellaceae bacterium]